MPIDSLGMKLAKRIFLRRHKSPWHETPRWLLHCIGLEHVVDRNQAKKA